MCKNFNVFHVLYFFLQWNETNFTFCTSCWRPTNDEQNNIENFRFDSSVYLHKRFKFVSMASTQNEWMLFLFFVFRTQIFVDDLVHLFKINSEKSIKYKFSKSLYAGAFDLFRVEIFVSANSHHRNNVKWCRRHSVC